MNRTRQSCSNCLFHRIYEAGQIKCHRFPPIITGNLLSNYEVLWPMVDEENWCGEWKKQK